MSVSTGVARAGVPPEPTHASTDGEGGFPLRPRDGTVARVRTKSEPIRKGAQTSYKSRGKKQKQGELFPDLLKEIEKKRAERHMGTKFTLGQLWC